MAVVKLTTANFDQEVLQADRPVLVDFYADWCGPCKMMGPVVEEISGELDDVKVCKINIDEEMEVAQRYGVMSIPTFIAFKKRRDDRKTGRRCSEGSACRSGKITKHSKATDKPASCQECARVV